MKKLFKQSLVLGCALVLTFTSVACADNNKINDNAENSAKTTTESSMENSEKESSSETSAAKDNEAQDDKKDSEVKEYKNIVAASKTIAEYLELFDKDLVGIAEQEDLPEKYANVTRIGAPRRLNLEVIVSLKPDLVVANDSSEKDLEQTMKTQGIETLYLDSSTYDSIFANIEQLGKLFGKEQKAENIVNDLKAKENAILEEAKSLQGKSAAILFGTGEHIQLATKHSYLGNLLEKIGVKNVADVLSDAENKYVPFSLEQLIAQNPDYILTLAHGNKKQAQAAFKDEFKKPLWQSTEAVKQNRLIHLDDHKYPVTGNIHVLETLEGLIKLLKEAGA